MITSEFDIVQLREPVLFGSTVPKSYAPSVTIGPAAGVEPIVFYRNELDLFASRVGPDGALAEPVKISAGLRGGFDAHINQDGDVVVTWGTIDGIFSGVYSPDLAPVTPAVNVFPSDNFRLDFGGISTVATTDGGFVLVTSAYRDSDEGDQPIFVRRYDPSGVLVEEDIVAPYSEAGIAPQVAVDSTGNICVTWASLFGDVETLQYIVYDEKLARVVPYTEFEVDSAFGASVTSNPGGGFSISYPGHCLRLNSSGAVIGSLQTDTPVSSAAASLDGYIAAAGLTSFGDVQNDIVMSLIAPDGEVIQANVVLVGSDEAYERPPSLDWVNSSTFMVGHTAVPKINLRQFDEYTSLFGVVHTQTGDGMGQLLQGDGLFDVMYGLGGNDTLRGQDGDDTLYGGVGADHLYGGLGKDRFVGGNGGGTDIVHYDDANYGNLVIHLGAPDRNTGAAAGDSFLGVEGVMGGIGKDHISGNSQNNMLFGRGGNDTLIGGAGDDVLIGGAGDDTFVIVGNDKVVDIVGIDRVVSSTRSLDLTDANFSGVENASLSYDGSFDLTGNAADNTLRGNFGDNVITGGLGQDDLTGLAGSDTFKFDTLQDTSVLSDRIRDFAQGEDLIDLATIDARDAQNGNNAFNFLGRREFSGVQGQLRYEIVGHETFVQGDVDGDRVADFRIILDGAIRLSAADFVL